jgi:hypothetical protein
VTREVLADEAFEIVPDRYLAALSAFFVKPQAVRPLVEVVVAVAELGDVPDTVRASNRTLRSSRRRN